LISTRFTCLLVMARIFTKGIGDCHITRIPCPFAPNGYCRTSPTLPPSRNIHRGSWDDSSQGLQ
jgi:hypothetical protein